MQFQDLNLNLKILKALENKGYKVATPIQEKAIPSILNKRDFLGIAQTGTGKTAAFALPIIQNLSEKKLELKPNSIRCLILTPTRELALQISQNIEIYGRDLHLKQAVIFGGVSEKPQIENLRKGLDIVIATPGRLLDLIDQGFVKFSQLEIFVLDEADRMLDMGFINDVKKIIAKLPVARQTLFFSATMPDAIEKLASAILNNPAKVEITPASSVVERIDQKIYLVAKSNKAALLKTILKQEEVKSALVFLRTKHGANRLVDFLEQHGIKTLAIHGNKSQGAREKALDGFRKGSLKILIATDIAARGIDVAGISHVINYEIPSDPESYVHRIGRTARAGRDGIAISFCDHSEKHALKAIEKIINYQIPIDSSHAYHGVEGQKGADLGFSKPKKEVKKANFSTKEKFEGGKKEGFNARKPRGESDSFGEKKPWGERKPRSQDDSFETRKPRSQGSSFGAKKPWGERKNNSESSSFGARKPRGESASFGEKKSWGERKPRSQDDSFETRKPRSQGSSFGAKKPWGERKNNSESSSFGARKPRGESASFGEKKPWGERKSGSETGSFNARKPRAESGAFDERKTADKKFFKNSEDAPFEKKPYQKPKKSNQAKFNARTKNSFGSKFGKVKSAKNGSARKNFRK